MAPEIEHLVTGQHNAGLVDFESNKQLPYLKIYLYGRTQDVEYCNISDSDDSSCGNFHPGLDTIGKGVAINLIKILRNRKKNDTI